MRKRRIKKNISFLIALCFCFLSSLSVSAENYEKSIEVKIPVECVGKGSSETFTFIINAESTDNQRIEERSITLRDGEKGFFLIYCDYPGTYSYTVVEEPGSNKRIDYDNTLYEVKIFVTEDENGELFGTPVVFEEGSSEKKLSCSFYNVEEVTENTNNESNSSSSENSGSGNSVKTGDNTNILLWLGVLVGSFCSIRMMLRKGGKSNL